MKVQYFNRSKDSGYSIRRVFAPIINMNSGCSNYDVPFKGTNPFKILGNLWFVFLKRKKRCIYHITGDIYYCALVLPSKNTIITYHDAGQILYWKGSFITKRIYFLLWFYLPIRHASVITCISEKTKEVLIDMCPWATNKMYVIRNPIGSEFQYMTHEFDSAQPRILQVGTGPSKNLKKVIKALSGISCQLRVIGPLSEDVKELLVSESVDYTNAINLSDDEIVVEYQQCDIVSFASVHEGFGLPLIEGFASGRIVVSSNIDPMKTLSEGAAILVDPFDVDSIKAGFMKAINDKDDRERLIEKGVEVSKKYRATEIYNQYLDIYNKISNH